ncbi:MAG: cupin domain-containing protein [bacterium]
MKSLKRIVRVSNSRLFCFLLIGLLLLTSCSTLHRSRNNGAFIYPGESVELKRSTLNEIYSKERFDSQKNKVAAVLSDRTSHKILAAQIREREKPHKHVKHDLIVYLYSGRGSLRTSDNSHDMESGDWITIPRDQPHQFINTAEQPARAIVIRTPNPDGKDYEPVESLE